MSARSDLSAQSDLTLDIPSDVQAIERAVEYVLARCESCIEDDHKLHFHFRVGLTEALSNAMLYGNREDPDKRVRVEVCVEESAVRVRVTDEGNGFDPGTVPDPTAPRNLEKPCGRGIFLMRQLLDDVRFNEEGNCVTLVLRRGRHRESGGGARA
ncbi:MAG: ATP-binding protein [Longimicrobiales bacterium]